MATARAAIEGARQAALHPPDPWRLTPTLRAATSPKQADGSPDG
jgi:hypothetical protein